MKKQYLSLLAMAGALACQAQTVAPDRHTSDLRQVAAQKPAPGSSVMPHQLSAEQRAELRRQLSQYSRLATGKGS